MAIHHKIPHSRGGSDDAWNLAELDDYTHAYEHALDFVLFETSPVFDCRQPGWKLLPNDLRAAVQKELSNRMKGNSYAKGSGHTRTGLKNGMFGKVSPTRGRPRTPEERQRISEAHKGKPKSPEHRENLSKAKRGKKLGPNTEETRRNKSEAQKLSAKMGTHPSQTEEAKESLRQRNRQIVVCDKCGRELRRGGLGVHKKFCGV